MSVAVLCPTRGRPNTCSRMIRSVIDSSQAHVLIYMDEDDPTNPPPGAWNTLRVKVHIGPRLGPVAAANSLLRRFPGHDVYGLLTDDSVVTTPGWDTWLLEVVKQFPNRVCVVSPHHNMGNHVDMPFVTKEWIKAVGWYACPDTRHYCWPTITGLIGEMTAICHAPEQRFHVEHEDHTQDRVKQIDDAQPFYEFVSLKLPAVVERVRQAMA